MMQRAVFGMVCAMLFCSAVADMYMHNPPGCNDRNRERSDNRNNGNRIFDSQNNAKGGYPWRGDADKRAAPDPLTYYAGSVLRLEWTNQHQCTGNNVQCQVIIQYACNDLMPGLRDGYPDSDNVVQSDNNNAGYTRREFNQNDGQNADGTNTISDNQFAGSGQRQQRLAYYYNIVSGNPGVQFGMHEGIDWYDLCKSTQRNKGLYHADQNLNRNDARATRQNPNGNRNGLECPEERDYYPYWRPYVIHPQSTDNTGNTIFQPAAWFDVAILTNNVDSCGFYRDNSQNVRGYGQCLCDANCRTKIGAVSNGLIPWDQATCALAQGNWIPNQGALNVDKPDCVQHDFNRDNNLGDAVALDGDGNPVNVKFQPETAHYLWTIPDRMADKTCVVRMRYNISTNDYPNMNFVKTNSLVKDFTSANDCTGQFAPSTEARKGNPPDATTLATIPPSRAHCFGIFNETVKPLFNRPYLDLYGNGLGKIAIALNSDQSSRTFQDRSYVFTVAPKPSGVGSKTIWNLNTRGRRGNIVQCYPAVEYDFVPEKLSIPYGDFLHIQLHGSDFNAAKNANNGEGWQYSDRHNILQTAGPGDNFPMALSKQTLFNNDNDNALAKRWALLEQPANQCDFDFSDGNKNDQNNIRNCGKLNSAANRYPDKPIDGLIRMTNTGTYFYVSTRNNNFSNRSQKGMLVVGSPSGLSAAAQAGIAVGVIAACALAFGGVLYYGKKNPGSKAGGMYRGLASCVSRGSGGNTTATKTAAPMPDMEYQRS